MECLWTILAITSYYVILFLVENMFLTAYHDHSICRVWRFRILEIFEKSAPVIVSCGNDPSWSKMITNFEAYSKLNESNPSPLDGSKTIWLTLSQSGKDLLVGNLALIVTFFRFFNDLRSSFFIAFRWGISKDFRAFQDFKMGLISWADTENGILNLKGVSKNIFQEKNWLIIKDQCFLSSQAKIQELLPTHDLTNYLYQVWQNLWMFYQKAISGPWNYLMRHPLIIQVLIKST